MSDVLSLKDIFIDNELSNNLQESKNVWSEDRVQSQSLISIPLSSGRLFTIFDTDPVRTWRSTKRKKKQINKSREAKNVSHDWWTQKQQEKQWIRQNRI